MRNILLLVESAVIVVLSACVVLVVFYGVLVRYLPISGDQMAWTEEIALLFLAWLTFMGAAAVHREHGHFTVDTIVGKLNPLAKRMVDGLVSLMSAAFLLFVAVNAFNLVRSTMGDISVVLKFPLFLIPLSLLIGSGLMVIYGVHRLIKAFLIHSD